MRLLAPHRFLIPLFAFTSLSLPSAQAATLGDQWDSAVERLVEVARKERLQTLLVIVREDSRSDYDANVATILQNLRDDLQAVLNAERLAGIRSKEIEGRPGVGKAFAALRPSDVAVFRRAETFDAVVTVDYRKQGRSRTVRVSLLDDKSQRLTRSVTVPGDAGAMKKSLAVQSNSGTAISGGGVAGVATGTSKSNGMSSAAAAGLSGILARGVYGTAHTQAVANGTATSGGTGTAAAGTSGAGTTTTTPTSTDTSNTNNTEVPKLNERILAFALSHLGEQVGNGECWTLAAEALKAAGAEPPRGYKFGDPVDLDKLLPGDILQFTSAVFEEPNIIKYFGFPNHTAIVYKVEGSRIHILQQHVGDTKVVMFGDVDLSTKTSGDVEAYRARPRGSQAGRSRDAEAEEGNGPSPGAAKGKQKCEKDEATSKSPSSSQNS